MIIRFQLHELHKWANYGSTLSGFDEQIQDHLIYLCHQEPWSPIMAPDVILENNNYFVWKYLTTAEVLDLTCANDRMLRPASGLKRNPWI